MDAANRRQAIFRRLEAADAPVSTFAIRTARSAYRPVSAGQKLFITSETSPTEALT